MKTNARTSIWTDLLVLVPYRASHVPQYHQWMEDELLQQLTASEPLSLEQEYEMQQAWLNDADKCTFILLDRQRFERLLGDSGAGGGAALAGNHEVAMIGDVNLFLLGEAAAEAEVMIAESWARGAGRGRQAAAAMLRYGVETLHLTRFEVKIGYDNAASRRMFAGMGLVETGHSDVFREVTLEVTVTPEWRARLEKLTPGYTLRPADPETPDDPVPPVESPAKGTEAVAVTTGNDQSSEN